jgi:hypothetical protein
VQISAIFAAARDATSAVTAASTRGEYRPLEGARHSTLTTDSPDEVIRAARDLIGLARR